jgi:hypothetical protein
MFCRRFGLIVIWKGWDSIPWHFLQQGYNILRLQAGRMICRTSPKIHCMNNLVDNRKHSHCRHSM